jgi:hypothetical protein
MFASRRGSLPAPVIQPGNFVLSFYIILINVCKHGKLTSGNQRATALSLAAKGSVLAEKRRTRCPFKRPFPHPWNALYIHNVCDNKIIVTTDF